MVFQQIGNSSGGGGASINDEKISPKTTWSSAKLASRLGKILEATLKAGETELTFEDDNIQEDSSIDISTNLFGFGPKDCNYEDGKITFIFNEKDRDVKVRLKISNDMSNLPNLQQGKWFTLTLPAGETELVIEDKIIVENSIIDVYTSEYEIAPLDCEAEKGILTITFEAQKEDLGVKVRVNSGDFENNSYGGSGDISRITGELISIMGTVAPEGFLVCDGSIYNISAYPRLAGLIETNYGSKNIFGGDGTDTFAVPDFTNVSFVDHETKASFCYCIKY